MEDTVWLVDEKAEEDDKQGQLQKKLCRISKLLLFVYICILLGGLLTLFSTIAVVTTLKTNKTTSTTTVNDLYDLYFQMFIN